MAKKIILGVVVLALAFAGLRLAFKKNPSENPPPGETRPAVEENGENPSAPKDEDGFAAGDLYVKDPASLENPNPEKGDAEFSGKVLGINEEVIILEKEDETSELFNINGETPVFKDKTKTERENLADVKMDQFVTVEYDSNTRNAAAVIMGE